jgi:hypothetical protein
VAIDAGLTAGIGGGCAAAQISTGAAGGRAESQGHVGDRRARFSQGSDKRLTKGRINGSALRRAAGGRECVIDLHRANVHRAADLPIEAGAALIGGQIEAEIVAGAAIGQHAVVVHINRRRAGQRTMRLGWAAVIGERADLRIELRSYRSALPPGSEPGR